MSSREMVKPNNSKGKLSADDFGCCIWFLPVIINKSEAHPR